MITLRQKHKNFKNKKEEKLKEKIIAEKTARGEELSTDDLVFTGFRESKFVKRELIELKTFIEGTNPKIHAMRSGAGDAF